MENRAPAIELRHISKRFGRKVANIDVSMEIRRGEILALLGENGSGKTTLMNILSGIYYPDEGQILVDGKEVYIRDPKDAFTLGIGMIHQHFKLVDVFSAVENIVLGIRGKLDLQAATEKIMAICRQYGFEIDPKQKVYDMSVSQKQTVEIVKVLYRGADILILDEPTAVLTPQEADRLFSVLRNMRNDGKSIVIITHKMNEVESLSDRVAVLRGGRYVGSMMTAETNAQEMTNMMVGRSVTLNINRPEPVNLKPRLVVKDLTVRSGEGLIRLEGVSFTANAGEVLGIAGISGSGQKELLEAIAGLQPAERGSVEYIRDDGASESLLGRNPEEIREMGVQLSFVPEDRLGMGLVGNMSISDNMMLRSFRRGHSPFTDRHTPRQVAEQVVRELEVSTPSLSTPVRQLSGGNVQKVLVGREINQNPSVLLTAYAVRGLDINASYTIYDLINRQKQAGVAVVFVGEDLDVLVGLADRILVLCGGRVSGIVDGRRTDKRELGLMMTQIGGMKHE